MIPREKIEAIVVKYEIIEKELSSGNIDPKKYAVKSKEYSDLGNIVSFAREYLKFDKDKEDLENILKDPKSDKEMISLAEKEISILGNKNKLESINLDKRRMTGLEPANGGTTYHCLNHVASPAITNLSIA